MSMPAPLLAQATTPRDQPAAAPAQANRTTVYAADFFAGFAPRTALDIARRVPGFSLELGDSDTRGFAGAAGNVVINGARPSSKAESLETTLARIPSRSVVRVEVGPGDLYGAEYSGKSQVLNVILSAEGGTEGNVTTTARRIYTGRLAPTASGSTMIKRGAATVNLSASSDYNYQHEEGSDTLSNPTSGEQLELRRKVNSIESFSPFLSGSWALERARDNAFRLNARFTRGRFALDQENRVTPRGRPQRDDSLSQQARNPVFEIGGDVTRPLAGGALKLVGLATRRKRDNFDAYYQRSGLLADGAEIVGGFEQSQDARRNETIGRLTWNRQDLTGFSFEAGGEAVLNTLDSAVELFVLDAAGGRRRIDLPIDDANVKERRAETFVNLGRNLTPALRIDGGLTFEYSQLEVRGDALADRTLKFLKPNLTLDWKPGGGWHAQLSVRRSVAQLDFFDFISAAELSNDRVNGGNANLLPQRTWEFRLTADRKILGNGLLKLDLGHDLVSLLQDRVLIFDEKGNSFDAPGNIGTGRRHFARLTVDAPLGQLWTGLRLKFNGQLQRTRVDDPITGEPRNFSGFYPEWQWQMEARRDAGRFSYGFMVAERDSFTFFRTNELDTSFNTGPYGTAFIEYRPDARTAVTLDVDNLFDIGGGRRRQLSFPNRLTPALAFDEVRERNRHTNIGLTIKRSLGRGVAKAGAGS
ncbi:MAG TPA: outer membrane beta-barrel protein [Sphingomicrobium sp.]|nr:outer membrane beta-barrel protein [Sphingomicrobium sp.]